MTIWAETIENTLFMALYGQVKPPKITWHHETLKHLKFWTSYRTNASLPKGSEKIIIPGQDGYLVRSWITIKRQDGKTEVRDLGRNWYDVLPQVVEKGPK